MGIVPPNMEHLMHPFLSLAMAAVGAVWILGLAWFAWRWLAEGRRQPPERDDKCWTASEAGHGAERAWKREAQQ